MAYTRKDVSTLTSPSGAVSSTAMLEVKRRGEYDEFVRTHIDYYVADGDDGLRAAHMTPSFLPWHRRFLLELEGALRKVDPSVTRARTGTGHGTGDDGRALDQGPARRQRAESGPAGDDRAVRLRAGQLDHQGGGDGRGVPHAGPRPAATADRNCPRQATWTRPWRTPSTTRRPGTPRPRAASATSWRGGGTGSGNAAWRNHNRVHRWVGGACSAAPPSTTPCSGSTTPSSTCSGRAGSSGTAAPAICPAAAGSGNSQRGRIIARNEEMPPWGVTPQSMEDHSAVYRYA